jgi:hypothetical protein
LGHGGRRPGAGRKPNPFRIASIAKRIMEAAENDTTGKLYTPLEFLVRVMHDEDQPFMARFEAAKAAAPYCHARLQSVSVQNDEGSKLQITFVDFGRKAVSSGEPVEAAPVAVIEQRSPMSALDAVLDDELEAID